MAAEEGWPKDRLRAKIDAIRAEQREIQDTLDRSASQIDHSRIIFHHALDLLTEPHRAYRAGDEVVRGSLDKAFFTRLYVDGGKVIDHHAEEPFDAILDDYRAYRITRTTSKSAATPTSHDAPVHHSAGSSPTLAGQVCDKPSRVAQAGQKLHPALRRYLRDWRLRDRDEAARQAASATTTEPHQVWRLEHRLSEADQQTLIASYLAGTSQRELAEQYGVSKSGVLYLLKRHGVRRSQRPKRKR